MRTPLPAPGRFLDQFSPVGIRDGDRHSDVAPHRRERQLCLEQPEAALLSEDGFRPRGESDETDARDRIQRIDLQQRRRILVLVVDGEAEHRRAQDRRLVQPVVELQRNLRVTIPPGACRRIGRKRVLDRRAAVAHQLRARRQRPVDYLLP